MWTAIRIALIFTHKVRVSLRIVCTLRYAAGGIALGARILLYSVQPVEAAMRCGLSFP